jgi:hypothetical protein
MAGRDDKREARARLLLGKLLAEIYSDECAAELLGEAVELDPGLVAARVELGFILVRVEDYTGMVEAFRDAIRIDPVEARSAAVWEPDEMEQLWGILRPGTPRTAHPRTSPGQGMPAEFREAGRLTREGGGHVGAGRDGAAVDALAGALRLDPTSTFAVAMLAYTCLLIMATEEAGDAMAKSEEVLREVAPSLAKILFNS